MKGKADKKYFCKIAGVDTVEAEVSPEEYIEGCAIDEQTNIFTLGALIFEFFGRFSDEEVYQRYCKNQFSPCSLSNWQLSEESYRVASKAVSLNKSERYLTFAEFFGEWKRCYDIWKQN